MTKGWVFVASFGPSGGSISGKSEELTTTNTRDCCSYDPAFGLVGLKANFGELLGPPHAGIFHQNLMHWLCLK